MIIIGEKINGAIPSVARAIEARDGAFIQSLAERQSEAGADFLDVCASAAPEREVETLSWLIALVQEACDTPLCIDSPNPRAIEAVLGLAKRPGLVNSVSCEGDKLDVLLPLIAETEWRCVALLCDNGGIPAGAEKRLEIAETIMERAAAFGIAPERLYIDPLVLALAADGSAMAAFTECCRALRARWPGVHITSGLSNISFGLPMRKAVNQAFLTLAMGAGMDSAILDPLNRELTAAVLVTDALLGNDRHCRAFTNAFRKGRIGPVK